MPVLPSTLKSARQENVLCVCARTGVHVHRMRRTGGVEGGGEDELKKSLCGAAGSAEDEFAEDAPAFKESVRLACIFHV